MFGKWERIVVRIAIHHARDVVEIIISYHTAEFVATHVNGAYALRSLRYKSKSAREQSKVPFSNGII